jgi:hypothetical protein
MPGFLLHAGATVLCAHAGTAAPTVPNPRVRVAGQPTVVLSTVYTVAGCSLASVPSPPCVTATWVVGALRIRSGGQPLLLQDSQSICAPTGTPLQVLVTQLRVKGA